MQRNKRRIITRNHSGMSRILATKERSGDDQAFAHRPLRHEITFVIVDSPLWKRVIAWERSRAASGYGIIWGDADRNKQEEFSAECHSMDWF